MVIDKTDLPIAPPDLPAAFNEPLHLGSICPNCGKGKLDYNGLHELECQACGFRDKSAPDCGCSFRADAV